MGWNGVNAVAVVLAFGTVVGATNALAGMGGMGGMGGGGGGLPPSITEPGWGKDSHQDCYRPRLVHTTHGLRWPRVWVCH